MPLGWKMPTETTQSMEKLNLPVNHDAPARVAGVLRVGVRTWRAMARESIEASRYQGRGSR
jgi:hypothetical protein